MSLRNCSTKVTVRIVAALFFTLSATLTGYSADPESGSESARLATYQHKGSTAFALSLRPKVSAEPSKSNDLLILMDTSASQAGLYRKDAMASLNQLLSQLNDNDRVKIVAVDIDSTDLTGGFVSSKSPEIAKAIAKLQKRIPLGSTDMIGALSKAAKAFENLKSTQPRHVFYIGDGMSKANLIDSEEFAGALKSLVTQKASVSSYAIGPDMNIALLAAVANQTGGNLIVDSDKAGITDRAAEFLLTTARGKVFWPESIKLPAEIVETYPATIPPLRSDRDIVLVGKLAKAGNFNITCNVVLDGKKVELTWPVASEPSNDKFSFLPNLIERAKPDNGITLPTLGSEGLRETGRMIIASSEKLTALALQAKARGADGNAAKLASAALNENPANDNALILTKAPALSENKVKPTLILQEQDLEDNGKVVQSVELGQALVEGRIRAEIKEEMRQAAAVLNSSPEDAIRRMKLALETVQNSADISDETKAQLSESLNSEIKQAQSKALEINEKKAQDQENLATAREKANLMEESARKEMKLQQLMAQFKSLIDEEKYKLAFDNIAPVVEEDQRGSQLAEVVEFGSEFNYNADYQRRKRELRHRKFIAGVLSVEESAIPFDDREAILYPDKEFWDKITREREKYKAVDLLKPDGPEAAIQKALGEVANFDFVDTPLREAMEEIAAEHKIPISLDTTAIEDAGYDEELPMNGRANGRSLRSSLRSLFRQYNFTYVIVDEELVITTDDAIAAEPEKYLTTKVYNVGDLVVPIQSGFGGGGFGAGQQGFGGGGQAGGGFGGQQGGGRGGGGFGGGGRGGGGLFCIQDDKAPIKKKSVSRVKALFDTPSRIDIEVGENETVEEAWDNYFKQNKNVDSVRIAVTAQRLSKYKKFNELVAFLTAAMRNNQSRPWMYQGLAVAMEANGSPKKDIERALLSAADFGAGADELMVAAIHLNRIGAKESALRIFKDIAKANPQRPEPYALALQIAKKSKNDDAIRWAATGILSQEWPAKHRHLRDKALTAVKAQMIRMERESRKAELAQLKKDVTNSLVRDCLIKVTWTGNADIDIFVEEPSGTICSLQNPRTVSGGVHIGDEFAANRTASIKGFSEYYVLPKGFKGEYRLVVNKVHGDIASGKVTVEISRQFQTKGQSYQRAQIELDQNGQAMVLFKLDQGRLKKPLEQHQIELAVEEQFAINRSILSSQLSKYQSSAAELEYQREQRKNKGSGLMPVQNRRRDAGFRPVITTLPTGAGMSVTAVVSADRRYVRISPIPFFSSISSVSTFTFTGGTGGQNGQGGQGQ